MQLRKLYDAGARDGDEVDRLRRDAMARRREEQPKYFPRAEQSLAEIAEYAASRGVAVGLENRYHFHEFPDPDEMAELLAEYPPNVAGFWLDVGHAEVLDRLGLGGGAAGSTRTASAASAPTSTMSRDSQTTVPPATAPLTGHTMPPNFRRACPASSRSTRRCPRTRSRRASRSCAPLAYCHLLREQARMRTSEPLYPPCLLRVATPVVIRPCSCTE